MSFGADRRSRSRLGKTHARALELDVNAGRCAIITADRRGIASGAVVVSVFSPTVVHRSAVIIPGVPVLSVVVTHGIVRNGSVTGPAVLAMIVGYNCERQAECHSQTDRDVLSL